jgi:exonuclease SbcC
LNELDQAKQRLNQIPPVDNLQELEKADKICQDNFNRLDRRFGEIKSKLDQKKGALQQSEGEGLYSKLAVAEEKVAFQESKYETALISANSVKLLRDTLSQCRQEAMESVFAPVNQRVSQKFQHIAGGQYGEISFNNQFMPETIAVQSRDTQVNPDMLSYGTQEQLNIIVRVILGEILAENEKQRQLVVLDDPLAHTDSNRHNAMLELLNEATDRLQLIILTCHPETYQMLNAKGFDLEELKKGINTNENRY